MRAMLVEGRNVANGDAVILSLAVTASQRHGTAEGRAAHADLVAILTDARKVNCVIAYVNAMAESYRRQR
jgi:replication-associated recombination protein RarA